MHGRESTNLASKVSGTTLRHLKNDGRLRVSRSLKRSHNGGGGGNVLVELVYEHHIGGAIGSYNGWDSKLVLLRIVEKLQDIISNDDTRLAAEDILSTHGCGFGSAGRWLKVLDLRK